MRAISLFLVFVLAKAAVLAGYTLPHSLWTPVAFLWQDAMVALVFAAVEWCLPKRPVGVLYWALVIYSAVNIPVGRALGTPLTLPMLRAAGGPLADSIFLYLTWTNCAVVLITLGAAAVLPRLLGGLLKKPRTYAAGLGRFVLPSSMVLLAVMGPIASARVETAGLGRNPLWALIASGSSRVHASPGGTDWRVSRFPAVRADDLSRFRGIAKGRNVVLVSLESTAAQYLSLFGGEYDLMPNLSELARHGVVFENAYSVYPESIKGLFSILCSTFPAFDSKTEAYENVPCRSIAEVLAKAGYHTSLIHSGRFGYLGMESVIRNRGYQTLEDAGDIGGNHESSFGVDEPATVIHILKWIDALPRGEPFFVTYLPIAGHHPYETPQRGPFPEGDSMGRYRNALRYGDESVGTLVRGLRERGLADNTVWIILGDHGEAFGQHEGNFGHTFHLYDENIRVPFVIAAPGLIATQVRSRNVVSLVDTAPTILDLLGMPQPEGYQGRSMLDSSARMALFFADYSLGLLGLRDGRYKFIYELESGRARIFDLDVDPQEKVDISRPHSQRSDWYTIVVRGWSGAQKRYLLGRSIMYISPELIH